MNYRFDRYILIVIMSISLLTQYQSGYSQRKPPGNALQKLEDISNSIETLSQWIGPAVVRIFVTGYAPGDGLSSASLLSKQRGSGSGVILDPNGYIVTNAHVIDGASTVKVLLYGADMPLEAGQSILKPPGDLLEARIIGIDIETDLAVLKVEKTDLPYIKLGNSDDLRKGQLVLAFGSPLGLENSVTMGVISAVARQLRPEDPMIYIQTDTPINPGNSGGPLVNTSGEVIGISTFILSQSGGHEGIGFAAPSNIVKTVYEQIVENGSVRRGRIGINVQTINPIMAAGLGLTHTYGVIISDVYPNSQAQKAGLVAGDIILSLNDKRMENGRQFDVNLYPKKVGTVVKLEILRNDKKHQIWVPVKERRDENTRFQELVDPEKNLIRGLGILAIDITPKISELLPYQRKTDGVLVAARGTDAPFWGYGLRPGDIIYALNNQAISDIQNLKEVLNTHQIGDAIVLQVQRGEKLMYVSFLLE